MEYQKRGSLHRKDELGGGGKQLEVQGEEMSNYQRRLESRLCWRAELGRCGKASSSSIWIPHRVCLWALPGFDCRLLACSSAILRILFACPNPPCPFLRRSPSLLTDPESTKAPTPLSSRGGRRFDEAPPRRELKGLRARLPKRDNLLGFALLFA